MTDAATVPPRGTSYELVQWLFFKALGMLYLAAFASFGVQIGGLIGSKGILPVGNLLHRALGAFGASAYRYFPTLFWLDSSDWFLKFVCVLGALFALLLVWGRFQRFAAIACYVLYLSLVAGGQDFMSYQWDVLLLEAGFLAIFLGYSRIVIWLFRWLLFRLMFLSGAVKLLSGDQTWRHLTALEYHYQTQPLPTPVSWYMHLLPNWFQSASVVFVFVVELALPFLIFAPRRLRFVAGFGIVLLQILIMLTGNYTFFNLLAISLCLFLLDDAALRRIFSREVKKAKAPQVYGRYVAAAVAAFVLVVSGTEILGVFRVSVPEPANVLVHLTAPFGVVNSYGLFAVMTTSRPEIIVEGSNDGNQWLPYEFQYKPGDVYRRPSWVAPYQPRLDWQMWFAALGSYQTSPWFVNFVVRLLQGSPDVLRLLAKNPFPAAPPRYIRAELYDYSFTDFATRRKTGAWWNRKRIGQYFPPISLADVQMTESQ